MTLVVEDASGAVLNEITLASEGGAQRPMIVNAVERVEVARNLTPYISTQEQAWLVLASRAVAKEATGISLSVAGAVGAEAVQGTVNRSYKQSTLGAGAVTVTNAGDSTVRAVLTVTGAPTVPEPAAERGRHGHACPLEDDALGVQLTLGSASDEHRLQSEVAVKHFPRCARHLIFRDQTTPCEVSGVSCPHARPELLAHC